MRVAVTYSNSMESIIQEKLMCHLITALCCTTDCRVSHNSFSKCFLTNSCKIHRSYWYELCIKQFILLMSYIYPYAIRL